VSTLAPWPFFFGARTFKRSCLRWILPVQDTLTGRRFKPAVPPHNWYRPCQSVIMRTDAVYWLTEASVELGVFGASRPPSDG
jgi:hypothetical protein